MFITGNEKTKHFKLVVVKPVCILDLVSRVLGIRSDSISIK